MLQTRFPRSPGHGAELLGDERELVHVAEVVRTVVAEHVPAVAAVGGRDDEGERHLAVEAPVKVLEAHERRPALLPLSKGLSPGSASAQWTTVKLLWNENVLIVF